MTDLEIPFEDVEWGFIPRWGFPVNPPLPVPTHVPPEIPAPVWRFAVGPGASSADPGPLRELSTAYGRTLVARVDGARVAQFTIDGRNEEAAELEPLVTDLWVWRDNVLMFRGRITVPAHSVDGKRHVAQFTAVDYRGMLAYRTVGTTPPVFTAVDQAEIAWELIDATQTLPGGDWGVTQGLAPAGSPRDRTDWPAGKSILDAISELGRVEGGFEWEISPSMELNIWSPRRGNDQGVVLDYGGTVDTVSQAGDPGRFGNVAILTGSSETVPVDEELAGIASDERGRFEIVESFPSITEQTTLTERAPHTLAAASQFSTPWTVTLTPLRWSGQDHLWVGDIARLRVDSGALGADLVRVAEVQITCGNDGTEVVTLGLIPEVE